MGCRCVTAYVVVRCVYSRVAYACVLVEDERETVGNENEKSSREKPCMETHMSITFVIVMHTHSHYYNTHSQLLGTGVTVHIATPPDTDTPGFAEENKSKVDTTCLDDTCICVIFCVYFLCVFCVCVYVYLMTALAAHM